MEPFAGNQCMTTLQRSKARNFSLTGFLKLVRFSNLLIIAFAQYMAGIFLLNKQDSYLERLLDPTLFLLSLSTVFIAAGGYIINDYYDVKIDIINKPKRVVIDRVLKRRIAIVAHTFFNIAGILIGLNLSIKVAIVNFIAAFLLWLYSNQLKRLPFIGNFTVALLTGLTLAVLAIYYQTNQPLIYIFATYAFFITLVREILKDIEDMRGDSSFGCKTLPIVWGIRKTKRLIFFLMALFITVLFTLCGLLLTPRVGYFFLILLIPITWLIIRLVRADRLKEFGNLSQLCKLIMLMGIVSMAFI
jgi:4-hydroxybenzoate polyprenyltransferase